MATVQQKKRFIGKNAREVKNEKVKSGWRGSVIYQKKAKQ